MSPDIVPGPRNPKLSADLSAAHYAPDTARRMREASLRFLDALTDEQRDVAAFEFPGDERYQWHYTPVDRNGLPLKTMNPSQRVHALDLMASGLSVRGAYQAKQIIDLEATLEVWERMQSVATRWSRDSELYYFSVFGDPSGSDPWAWRAGGHHIGLHFTVIDRQVISPLPLFFGANPAEVRHGSEKGKRILSEEEDLARAVLASLDDTLKAQAIVDSVAPDDILTKNYRTASPGMPLSGLAFAAMTGVQRDRLTALIRHYVNRAADEVAGNEWRRIEAAGLDTVTFAWAGPEDARHGHYYSVLGRQFMIEYDNTQNGGNHIHSVWRDFEHDWGEDLLASHYLESAHR